MKKLLLIFFPVLFLSLNACKKVNGDGPIVTEERNPTDFNALHYELSGTLYFETAPAHSVEIRAQRNIVDVIETYVSGGELKIKLKNNTVIHSHEPIEVFVKGPEISGFHLSGSGAIKALQPIETTRLWLESSGSGDIELGSLEANELETRISGSGRISIVNGRADTEKIKISGSGKMELTGLRAQKAYTETSGSGDIRLWAEELLDSEISGSGSVRYKGNPQVKLKVTGSGKVQPLD